MNILLIGTGGREHALAKAISKSDKCTQLFIAKGNPGTASLGKNIAIDQSDFKSLLTFCISEKVEIVVVGPEVPLAEGIRDYFEENGLRNITFVGPSKLGAQLEASKAFAKKFMHKHNVPTAGYLEVTEGNLSAGIDYMKSYNGPYVLKADGLAAGKGVLIIQDQQEAIVELESMISGKFGDASSKVVIEQFLSGIEFSVFAMTDGENYVLLPEAKDYKRIGEGDTGLNTGGMGAVSPVPFFDDTLRQKVINTIVEPTIKGLKVDKLNYQGFVFFGLILQDGEPFVIEYNCRMGDPETEVVIPRLESDIVELFIKMGEKKLNEVEIKIYDKIAATVMLVSGGYPEAYEKGKPITGTEGIENSDIYHAGTMISNDLLCTNGGRVMAITSMGDSIKEAVNKSLKNADRINFEGKFYRRDIGKDLMEL
jgi:phosphoribosylamine--glycine ligase